MSINGNSIIAYTKSNNTGSFHIVEYYLHLPEYMIKNNKTDEFLNNLFNVHF